VNARATRRQIVKGLRANLLAAAALVCLVLMGSTIGGYILANQRLNWPGWIPVIGESHFKLRAELETVQGVLPGQGQAVNISGVRVGDINGVDLVDGRAVATLNIEPGFARIYPDATILLRPKTSVKDMVIELDPGTPAAGRRLESGALIKGDSTLADVNFSDFLETLDADTRDYLRLLVGDAGRALGDGGGRDFANTLRRFPPLSRSVARATGLVARRRERLERVMSNFSKLMSELGAHDRELARFVQGSASVFRRLANQNQNIASTIELLPPALDSSRRALTRIERLGDTLDASLGQLRPAARALGPTLEQLRPFLRETVPPIRDQLRPFSREARPTARTLLPAARDLSATMPSLQRFTEVLNALFDELAYDPPGSGIGKEGYLFHVPWASHNTNSTLAAQDAIGPMRRALVLMNCGSLELLGIFERRGDFNPTLSSLVRLLNAPDRSQVCPAPEGGE
jgi:phospholipid/cholesterol/gamma-HCH transport system substrate-binding protein